MDCYSSSFYSEYRPYNTRPSLSSSIRCCIWYWTNSGVLALFILTICIIGKLLYESLETIDPGPMEAMTAVGANKIKWIVFGVVPQAISSFMSYVLFAFEINIRASAVLGLVGAGGIGLFYDQTLGLFQYKKTAMIILFTLVIVVIIDFVSSKVREKLA